MKIYKYDEFQLVQILENYSDETPITFEWDIKKETLIKKIITKLPKEKVIEYFNKFIENIKNIPENTRKNVLMRTVAVFSSVVPLAMLLSNPKIDKKVVKEIENVVNKTVSFDKSHELVANVEKGYSDDKDDKGNWISFKNNGKIVKRFIGTKYGISAPILKEFLGRIPKKEDMLNLEYEDAIKIYKEHYWGNQNLKNLQNQSIADIIYDGCVNQGIAGIKNVMRKSLRDNGIDIKDNENPFDQEWITIINSLQQDKLFNTIKKYRESRYKKSSTFSKHGDGWLNRLSGIKFNESFFPFQ